MTDLSLDMARAERHQRVLLDRARTHDDAKEGDRFWHGACAASLIRDAASVAAMRGDAVQAKELFYDAGVRYAAMGLFFGLSLLEYGKAGAARIWLVEHDGFDGRIMRAMGLESGSREERRTLEPLLFASAVSPRQLLHLYQTLVIDQSLDASRLLAAVGEALQHVPELQIGPTGVPLAAYLRLLDEVAR